MVKKQKNDICAFCGQYRQLCESHIQPRWLYRDRDHGSGFYWISESDPFRKIARIGPYEYLLCRECEDHIEEYDNYSAEFFRAKDDWAVETPSGTVLHVVHHYDYKLLKLFLMSVLWRAAEATHAFFSSVTIETPVLERLYKMLRANDPGTEAEFSVMISMRTEFSGLEKIGESPKPTVRQDGNRWYRFDLNEFVCDIKVGCEPTSILPEMVLKPNPPFFIYEGPIVMQRMNKLKQMSLDQQDRERQFKENHRR